VLQIANDDMPFLVDSVSMAMADMGIGVHVLGHPVVCISRDKSGRLVAVGEGNGRVADAAGRSTASGRADAGGRIPHPQGAGRGAAIVRDWGAMRERMVLLADDSPPGACRSAIRDGARRRNSCAGRRTTISLFGFREYRVEKEDGDRVLKAVDGTGLGLLRGKDASSPRKVTSLVAHLHPAVGCGRQPDPDQDQCALQRAPPGEPGLHRRARVRRQGQRIGEQRFVACTPPAPTTAARGKSRWYASATST
jgi:glutamate dehydrogenase